MKHIKHHKWATATLSSWRSRPKSGVFCSFLSQARKLHWLTSQTRVAEKPWIYHCYPWMLPEFLCQYQYGPQLLRDHGRGGTGRLWRAREQLWFLPWGPVNFAAGSDVLTITPTNSKKKSERMLFGFVTMFVHVSLHLWQMPRVCLPSQQVRNRSSFPMLKLRRPSLSELPRQ